MKLKPQTFLIREPNPNPEPQTLNPELGTQKPPQAPTYPRGFSDQMVSISGPAKPCFA